MKRIIPLFLVFSLLSCSKEDSEPMLVDGEFNEYLVEIFENDIDMTQTNKFSASNIVGEWIPEKASLETYVDGELTESKDISFNEKKISFYKWGTMMLSSTTGRWTYSHNFLIYQFDNSDGGYAYEVMASSSSILVLRNESFPLGVKWTPFYRDKSGKHNFYVTEYRKVK